MASEILPALVLGAGALGTWGASAWRERSAASRERVARSAEGEVARDAFQRQTLLDMQEALLALFRTASQIRTQRVRIYRQTKRYGREADGEDLSEANRDG